MKALLLIPRLRVQNANALSSPYTIGFPAMTAWLGAVHALERKINRHESFKPVRFSAAAVICHAIDLQTYRDAGDSVFVIIGTGNPLNKQGQRCAFIEEARCHLDVSLVIRCESLDLTGRHGVIDSVVRYLTVMKMASGDILGFERPELIDVHNGLTYKKLIRRLMPGYCLIERRDLMMQAMKDGRDAIDALLDYLTVFSRCSVDENGCVSWHSMRKQGNWIVPVATGFHGISPIGTAENQRDPVTPHRFAESIVTLGEFVMPYRISNLNDMFWHAQADLENDLYLCQQNNLQSNYKETGA